MQTWQQQFKFIKGGDSVADMFSGKIIVELKHGVRDARFLRDSLVQIAAQIAKNPQVRGFLCLENTELTEGRIKEEIGTLSQILRPEIFSRLYVFLTTWDRSKLENSIRSEEDLVRLREEYLVNLIGEASKELSPRTKDLRMQLPTTIRRKSDGFTSILRLLLAHALMNSSTLQLKVLGQQSGFSYSAIASTLKQLVNHIFRASDRSVSLASFPESAWHMLVAQLPKIRPAIEFVIRGDREANHRAVLDKLAEMGSGHIAVGGGRGLRFHFPPTDPALEADLALVIWTHGGGDVMDALHQLHPGLEPAKPGEKPTLTTHRLDRPEPHFRQGDNGILYADPVECLLDLHETAPGFDTERFLRAHLRQPAS